MNPKKKILIVDDEPKNLKILKIRLEHDYDLVEAATGEQALEILKTIKPSVILLDIMMPGLNGLEVTQQIRQNPDFRFVKIILLSGKAMINDKLEGYHSGADDYITKPFDSEELKAKLRTLTKLHDVETQLLEMNTRLEEQVQVRSDQLLRAERMAFVGLHSCEIVHNLKNPLTLLKFYLEMFGVSLPEEEAVKKMQNSADKIQQIISDVLRANCDLKDSMVAVDVNAVIQEELEILKLDTFNKQKVTKDIQLQGSPRVNAAPIHIHQVLGNLLKNSFESMHGMKEGKVTVHTKLFPQHMTLTISDTGCGIPAEHLAKIYDPLFTTKTGEHGEEKGSGLGLAYCKKMIESYGGKISVNSSPGKGSSFLIELPLLTDTAAVEKTEAHRAAA